MINGTSKQNNQNYLEHIHTEYSQSEHGYPYLQRENEKRNKQANSNLFMSSFNDLHFAAWERTAIRECCRYIEWVQYITLFDIRHQIVKIH